ncbi:unnamed protein product [Lymnaea stagnalis]|uniref:Cysteine dioxygenase n=1 Tax=Lymnaea stagnalis TaxID=6523 RepID=A0AAV2H8E5_LYMST
MDRLIRKLDIISWANPYQAKRDLYQYLMDYENNEDDWRGFYHLNENEGYSRNEIRTKPGQYNVALMCWRPNQGNKIHDHCESFGLFKVLRGCLEEEHHICREDGDAVVHHADILIEENHVNSLESFTGFHRLKNHSDDDVAVSLHVYAPPLEKCTFIDEEGKRCVVSMRFATKSVQEQE